MFRNGIERICHMCGRRNGQRPGINIILPNDNLISVQDVPNDSGDANVCLMCADIP
jgi:hypothetical protein